MEIDWNAIRARFSGMTRDELLEEAALRATEYTPQARRILEGETLARGISAAQIEERRGAESSAGENTDRDRIDAPALLTSSDEKGHVLELVATLRARGIPSLVRELDARAFQSCGHIVGRWGLMVPETQAGDAARILESVIPAAAPEESAAAACGGGCGSCGGAHEPTGEEWPEGGDWWKTVPDENGDGREQH